MRVSSWRRGTSAVVVLATGLLSGVVTSAEVKVSPAVFYSPKPTLEETLQTARLRIQAWSADQKPIRDRVTLGPWLMAEAADEAAIVSLVKLLDRSGESNVDKARWRPSPALKETAAVKLPAFTGPWLLLTRTLHSPRPQTLTIGLGGGNRLDVWFNGEKVHSQETALPFGRYGGAEPCEGTRVDQVLVDLPLIEGENRLVVGVTRSRESSFYFSVEPDPTAEVWRRIRADFSQATHPLLGSVPAEWFDREGWLAAKDVQWERALLKRLAGEAGKHGAAIETGLAQLVERKAAPSDRQWLDWCSKAAALASLNADVGRLRNAVTALGQSHPEDYPSEASLKQVDAFERKVSAFAQSPSTLADPKAAALLEEMPRLKHEMLVRRNPMLAKAEIVFVKRYTYNSKHYYDDFQHISRFGGNLCVLSLPDGRVRELVPQLSGGVFDRYDLSFDGRRILFGYRRPQREGFRVWEVGVDGSGLRQVTQPPPDEDQRMARFGRTSHGDGFYGLQGYGFWTDDVHPCYLPGGDISFASTRSEHGVLCTELHYLACTNLYRSDNSGRQIRPLSCGALSEFTPTMMEDGRILYNRWEYVYKGIGAVQSLWAMRPDGSASEEFYGNNITNPGVFWQARQVPGRPHLAVCIGCGHEPLGVGSVLLIDLSRNDKRSTATMTSLTPEVRTQNLRGIFQLRNGRWREDFYGPLYSDPYPLSDKFFLVSCNPGKRYNEQSAYGIHLLDVFGNCVPIYSDPAISSWQPMLLQSRKAPPVLPAAKLEGNATGDTARVFLNDVYRGLDGVERGTVKYLRVMEQVPKPWSAELDPIRSEDRKADGYGGHLVISRNKHIWVAVLRGIVPVQADGSALFEVPAQRNLFFQALDADFMEVQRMRTFVNFQPGESRSCVGCHEHRTEAPVSRPPLAFGRPVMKLAAQPGEVAPRPLYYPSDVQPVLDRHCVRCHNAEDPKTAPDLRGELTVHFNRSYEDLLASNQVESIREWGGASYAMLNAEAVPPYSHGSHRSPLVALLKKGHYEVKVTPEEWIRLVTWIDCGAPYYGSYFGRRHIKFQGDPDFRPAPTLESALGIPPKWITQAFARENTPTSNEH